MNRKVNLLFTAFLTIGLLNSCTKHEDPKSYSYHFESYRYELWKNLVDYGFEFDFVGTRTDDGLYKPYQGKNFDPDHQGTGGIQTDEILQNLPGLLSSIATPDIVLLGAGGNDLLNGDPVMKPVNTIKAIIDVLQRANPNVIILVEQIAPIRSDAYSIKERFRLNHFNNQIAKLAAEQTGGKSSVVVVDMNSGWSDFFFADEVHYNIVGASVVAYRYYSALRPFLSEDANFNILPLGDSRVEGNRKKK